MIISEITTNKLTEIDSSGWVSPDGNHFYPCKYGDHDLEAVKILEPFGKYKPDDAADKCLSMGYIRVEKESVIKYSLFAYDVNQSRFLIGLIIRRLPMYVETILIEGFKPQYYKKLSMIEAEKFFK